MHHDIKFQAERMGQAQEEGCKTCNPTHTKNKTTKVALKGMCQWAQNLYWNSCLSSDLHAPLHVAQRGRGKPLQWSVRCLFPVTRAEKNLKCIPACSPGSPAGCRMPGSDFSSDASSILFSDAPCTTRGLVRYIKWIQALILFFDDILGSYSYTVETLPLCQFLPETKQIPNPLAAHHKPFDWM